jgi:RNA polymerase-associated protein LEO1
MKIPSFLRLMPIAYDRATFEPTEWDIANETAEAPAEVVRFYHDPDTGEMKSNANLYRWSDGSLTLSVGEQHYPIKRKIMAPPAHKPYSETDDSHMYAAAAHLRSGIFLVVGHVSEEYTVRLSKAQDDDALQKLAMRYRQSQAEDGTTRIIKTTHDPELQRKQAELAEKERMRAQRKRENAAARLEGGPRGGRGGLSIDDLEGPRRGAGGARKRGAPGGGKSRRRRDEYDSDDDRPDGARKEDYDMNDDFIAPSDEEISEEEEEEEEILEDEDERPRPKRQKTSDVDEDEDAEGDMDDDVQASHKDASRHRRRHVIDDDDEE